MNLPNKLTVLRVVLIPFFLAALLCFQIPYHMIWALIIFAVASVTDWFDGKIARKNNLVTTFGKFLDPLAEGFGIIHYTASFKNALRCKICTITLLIESEIKKQCEDTFNKVMFEYNADIFDLCRLIRHYYPKIHLEYKDNFDVLKANTLFNINVKCVAK